MRKLALLLLPLALTGAVSAEDMDSTIKSEVSLTNADKAKTNTTMNKVASQSAIQAGGVVLKSVTVKLTENNEKSDYSDEVYLESMVGALEAPQQ